jgi:hypothetical protein
VITATCVEQGAVILVPQAFTPNNDGDTGIIPDLNGLSSTDEESWSFIFILMT